MGRFSYVLNHLENRIPPPTAWSSSRQTYSESNQIQKAVPYLVVRNLFQI
jgi:hypothetical protein